MSERTPLDDFKLYYEELPKKPKAKKKNSLKVILDNRCRTRHRHIRTIVHCTTPDSHKFIKLVAKFVRYE